MKYEVFNRAGEVALGSKLRLLVEALNTDASLIYNLYGVELKPKWFTVFFSLVGSEGKGITEISKEIGQTHPSVVQIVKEMQAAGLTKTTVDPADKRRTQVSLTPKAQKMVPVLLNQCHDMKIALQGIDEETHSQLSDIIDVWMKSLDEKSLFNRVVEQKVAREGDSVQIVDYDDSKHHKAFLELNKEWINTIFHNVEPKDLEELDHPVENILRPGGFILIAEENGKPVGTCAMMPTRWPEYDCELVKFAVDPSTRGKGIGNRLIAQCLEKARMLGKHRIFLESNKKCESAVHLYEKYGFKHLPLRPSEFDRCDVQMETNI
ncbi:MAG: bifunctional helix-turn-helix transcriptional regulator/GNAT family N-acetyltransferase [Prevotella sp.]|jgi:DNA-binding MarR family transcriptional regulator/GNAT superfamily N-acetyltransferase